MINRLYILFLFSLAFSISFDKYESDFYSKKPILSYNSNNVSKNIFKSLVLPGWGQYKSGDYKKAFVFLCIESIAFSIYYNYDKKGSDLEALTREFGDKHWSFSTWIADYYSFENSNYRYIFEREETGTYKELWEGGHKIEFWYDNATYTTGDNTQFRALYDAILCPTNGNCNDDALNSVRVNKDHHYYENIGKYDHFFTGWDDNGDIYEFQKSSGELIAMSPNKKQYRSNWEDAAAFNRVADYALYALYTNHVLSLLDILVFSKINKNNKVNYAINTTYNSNNKMGIGGVVLTIAW